MSGVAEFKHFFPIDSIQRVCDLFHEQLRSEKEPDLALFSIIVGAVENNLTNVKNNDKEMNLSTNKFVKMKFPCVEWEEVKSLHDRFVSLMKAGVDAKLLNGEHATRDLVKRVADVVWNSLTRSYYKDRAHLQSIYSFLTGNKLDCFGVAFAVTAGCQVLGKRDVHLALSEDHAWVVFGKDGSDTAEVTWHGKGNEDKRGRSVGDGVSARSWLYVAGKPVVCTRIMELAALVSSINPTLTPTIDVHEVAQMQHKLLWLLYDKGQLDAYPMALGNLGDLDEYMKISNCTENTEDSSVSDVSRTNSNNGTPRPDSAALYAQAIRSSRVHYEDRHVYPYTFQGGYYHRHKMYKEAFHAWACAGDVIRHYNYSRDDEEIYKEFSEIANELIPQLMKAESSGHSARSILKDPECFASLLRFYDGICKWEEGSQTPILHIGWAKPLVSTISKFDAEVRAQVHIICSPNNDEHNDKFKDSSIKEEKEERENEKDKWNNNSENIEMSVREQLTAAVNSRPRVTLYSHKMAALKPLLLAERLNTHALQLQLTAQSQLQRPQAPMKRRDDDEPSPCTPTPRAKRARRER
ncbi:menin [Galleria mellonella]|uniref:Menin n=1 Tax=Galleria mellonella TaxID=7137 RepID=A0A6J1WEC8_GALME|nr:menin [Galleria mellonella]XP_052756083.1 menin [Galleria mellonella]